MSYFTSHTAHLANGIDYFYIDSGAPAGSQDYTTIVILHGIGFTAENFNRLHQYGPAMNLRIVAVNRRDYPGTTPYTDEELDDWNSGKSVAWDRISVQLGQFLEYLVKKENIPKISEDRKKGGIGFVGWSLGGSHATTLFLDRTLIPHDLLEPYVKDFIFYDPPFPPLGMPLPEDADLSKLYLPFANPENIPVDELVRNFAIWVSSYFDHPAEPKSVNELPQDKRGPIATTDSFTPEDWENQFSIQGAARSETKPEGLGVSMKRAADALLLNVSKPDAVFPKVHITYISGTRTPWTMWWPYLASIQEYKERKAKGVDSRRIVFIQVEGANHLIHYDMPEVFLKAVVFGMNADDEDGEVHKINP